MKLKQDISNQTSNTEEFFPVLEKMRQDFSGIKVPDGYFDSLNPHIVDRLNKKENRSLLRALIPQYRKPLVWKSIMAVMVFSAMIISFILVKRDPAVLVNDEWTQINMAYDESYAQEALLAESNSLDKELESSGVSNIGIVSLTHNEPSVDEITEYLKDQEIDTDILNEY